MLLEDEVIPQPEVLDPREFDIENSPEKNNMEVLRKLVWHEIMLWHSDEECEIHLQTLKEHESNFQEALASKITLASN